jgi:hypothetical protein
LDTPVIIPPPRPERPRPAVPSGQLAFAVSGAGVGRQGEGEIVIVAARVRPRRRRAAGEADPRRAEIARDLREHGFRVIELEVDGLARVEQRGADRDVIAQERLHSESIEATLKLAATIQPDVASWRAAGLVVAHERALAVARNVETVDIASDIESGARNHDGHTGIPWPLHFRFRLRAAEGHLAVRARAGEKIIAIGQSVVRHQAGIV